jgi:branched-chain amino acid transport system permease protein
MIFFAAKSSGTVPESEEPANIKRPKALPGTILLVVLGAIPLFVHNYYYIDLLILVGIYITLALGLSIIVGNAGLLSLGYAAFFAIGAYTTAIFCAKFNISFWLTVPLALLFAAISGIVIGWPTLRLRGDYLAMVTLGFGEIVRITATNLNITGAADGIFGVPAPTIGPIVISQSWQFYYLTMIMAILTWIGVARLGNSRIGRAWACTRDDEKAAEAMGINTVWVKLLAFIVGSMWAGLAGTVFVVKMTAVAPETFAFMQSCMILLGVVIGGMNNVTGVALGAAIVIILPEMLRGFESARMLAFGIALVLVMLFRPQGLLPARQKTSRED